MKRLSIPAGSGPTGYGRNQEEHRPFAVCLVFRNPQGGEGFPGTAGHNQPAPAVAFEIGFSGKLKKESPLQNFPIIVTHGDVTMIAEDDKIMLLQGGCYSLGQII